MTPVDTRTINRRGCLIFLAFLVLIAIVIGWFATMPADRPQADKALSESTVR
jgi:uncharacterized protein YpmS